MTYKSVNKRANKLTTMEAFLNSYHNKETRRLYKRGIDKFVEWYGKTVDEILTERKDDLTPRPNENLIEAKQRADNYEKLLETFYFWLESEGYVIPNVRYNYCKGLRQLFRYYNMGFTLRTGSPINQKNVKIDDFPLKPDHVRKMFHVAKDLRTKLLVTIGNDLGWRINDVLSLKRNELPNLDAEPPIEWLRYTQKEGEVSKTCLSRTTVTLLKEYIAAFPNANNPNNPYLFFNSEDGALDDYVVNRRLKDLAEDAQIELGNLSLTWHCLRKMIISTAKNLSIDPDIVKLMVGKAVDQSMLPYLNGIDVKTAFIKLQTVTGLTTFSSTEEDQTKALQVTVKKFETALSHIENENATLKFRFEQQQKQNQEQNKLLISVFAMDFKLRLDTTKKELKQAIEQMDALKPPEISATDELEQIKAIKKNVITIAMQKLEKLNSISADDNDNLEVLTNNFNQVTEIRDSAHEAFKTLSTKNIKITIKD